MQVIRELEEAGAVFRVLALSATPGSNTKAVKEVMYFAVYKYTQIL